MKTKNLTIAILFLFSINRVVAQNAPTPIPIDFSDLKAEYKKTVKYNSTFTVVVSNINRNLYKIDGVKTETDYNIAVPAALSAVKLPQFAFFSTPKTSLQQLPSTDSLKSSTGLLEYIASLQKKIAAYSQTYGNAVLLNNDLGHLAKECAPDYKVWKSAVVARTDHFLTGKPGSGDADVVATGDNLEKTLTDLSPTAQSDLVLLTKAVEDYAPTALAELAKSLKENKKAIEEINAELKDRNLSAADREEDKKKLKIIQQFVDGYDESKKQVAATAAVLSKNLEKATASVEEIKKAERDDKLFPIVKLYRQLVNPNTFTYTSETITAKTDEIKFTLTIEPTELNTCSINSKKIVVVTVKVDGGFKIDFSTGAFINGGSDKFLGNTYYYHNIDANSREIVTADRGSRNLLSVGALMHMYRRSSSDVKLAGSVGVSTTANLNDLNFHVGPSLIIGNQNRIVITGGLTLKSSAVLDQKLSTNKTYTKLESPDTIPTLQVFPIGGYFFAITYNFSKFTSAK